MGEEKQKQKVTRLRRRYDIRDIIADYSNG